jgi:hypothetical protein
MRRSEFLAIIMGKSEEKACRESQDAILQAFVKDNIILVNDVNQYVVISEAYERYRPLTDDPVSRHVFARKIRELYSYSIMEMVKRINGTPVRTFTGCKLDMRTSRQSDKHAFEGAPRLEEGDSFSNTEAVSATD